MYKRKQEEKGMSTSLDTVASLLLSSATSLGASDFPTLKLQFGGWRTSSLCGFILENGLFFTLQNQATLDMIYKKRCINGNYSVEFLKIFKNTHRYKH